MLLLSYFFCYITTFYSIIITIKSVINRSINGYVFIIPILLLFFIFPSITDLIFDVDYYGYSKHISLALKDETTNIIYNCYISFVVLFFTIKMKKARGNRIDLSIVSNKIIVLYRKYTFIFWICLLLPGLIVVVSGDLGFYLNYSNRREFEYPKVHLLVNRVQYLSLISGAIIITYYYIKKHSIKHYLLPILLVLIMIGINVFINGKRSILVKYFVIQFIFLFLSGRLKPKVVFRYVVVMVSTIVFFLSFYGKNISTSFLVTYYGLRLDFSRDYGLKFVIYNDLLGENNILPYKGASYLFNLLFFIPRSLFPDKPQPYAVYFTNSALGDFGGDHLYGWGLTTSFVIEAVSNMGWLGLLFFPIFYSKVINIEQKSNNPFFKMLCYMVLILLLVVQPIAFMPLILLMVFMYFRKK